MSRSQIVEGLLYCVWGCAPSFYKKCRDIERLQTAIDTWRMNFRGLALNQ